MIGSVPHLDYQGLAGPHTQRIDHALHPHPILLRVVLEHAIYAEALPICKILHCATEAG